MDKMLCQQPCRILIGKNVIIVPVIMMLQLAKPQKCHSKVSLDAVINIIWLKKTTIRVVRAFLPYCRYSSTPPPPPLISQTLIYCIIIPTISSCIPAPLAKQPPTYLMMAVYRRNSGCWRCVGLGLKGWRGREQMDG